MRWLSPEFPARLSSVSLCCTYAYLLAISAFAAGCSSSSDSSSDAPIGAGATGGQSAGGSSAGTAGSANSGGANGGSAGAAGKSMSAGGSGGATNGGASGTGTGATGGSAGSTSTGGVNAGGNGNAGTTSSAGSGGQSGAPDGFWDATGIPAAMNVMMFKFLNRTNGVYQDSEVYWSFKLNGVTETHSIADMPTYDMPANASGRMYFYICGKTDTDCATDPTQGKYYDFIEHTIDVGQYNGNTTRVDAFGLKIAMKLHSADGSEEAVGEDYDTFLEDRTVTFQKFLDDVPDEFKPLAMAPFAPYRIVQPGAAGFDMGGANANYYDSFVDELWAANLLTIDKPGPNGSNLAKFPDISAAIFRHVGNVAGSFNPDGSLLDKTLWADSTTFYAAAPADYYARFWHEHGLGGKAYGFPYDDVGSYSTYISHKDPQYMLVAIGW